MTTEIFQFFRDEASAQVSNSYHSSGTKTDGILEIVATEGTTFKVIVQGSVDFKGPRTWTNLACVAEEDLKVVKEITTPGIYDFSSAGKAIRVEIVSISGGTLTAIGQFVG